jgi:hypothetical protein
MVTAPSSRIGQMRTREGHRWIRWLGLVVTGFTILAWCASEFRVVSFNWRSPAGDFHFIAFGKGVLDIVAYPAFDSPFPKAGWHLRQSSYDFPRRWLPAKNRLAKGFSIWVVPIWILLVLIAIPTVRAFWAASCGCRGGCSRCGYDLTGNMSGRCPECGQSTDVV